MIVGKIYEFTVVSSENDGHYVRPLLEGQEDREIFMPHLKSDPARSQALKVGDEVEAFLHSDDEGDWIASLLLPVAEVDEFAILEVVGTQSFGAFLDWGLEKDLFVSAKKQKTPMNRGEFHLVRICYDSDSGKLYGTSKFGSLLESLDINFDQNDEVEIIPVEEHQLGYRCIVNRKFLGMLYHSELFTEIELGEIYQGHVKKVREDGLIDLALQPQGIKNLDASQQKILDYLKEKGGKSHLHDKSSPDEIRDELGMSKKSFKNTIGMLYKAKKIVIKDTGIELA
jgi:predicted RNA-binding protein (virulence factor B family)